MFVPLGQGFLLDAHQVGGCRMYGSGYPGLPGGTVAGRGFPFLFWPVVWGTPGYGGHYLHSNEVRSMSHPLSPSTF